MNKYLCPILGLVAVLLLSADGTAWARGGGGRGGGGGRAAGAARGNRTAAEAQAGRSKLRKQDKTKQMYEDRVLEENREAILRDALADTR